MPSEYSGSGDPRRTIELLFGSARRAGTPGHHLSGDQIVARLSAHATGRARPELSMLRLADELGITAMSLFILRGRASNAELLNVMARSLLRRDSNNITR